MIHVGLDLSLTSTGIAVLEPGKAPRLGIVTSKPLGSTLVDRDNRLERILREIRAFIYPVPGEAALPAEYRFMVEAPTYGATMNAGSQHDRAGLWWRVVENLLGDDPVTEVSPTTVKAFATGKGNAGKPQMMAATAQQFVGVPFQSDDDSDALWIAALSEYVENPDAGRVSRTAYRDKAAKAVPRG